MVSIFETLNSLFSTVVFTLLSNIICMNVSSAGENHRKQRSCVASNLPLLVTSYNDNINQLIDGFQLLPLGAETAVKPRLSGILTVL